MKKIYQMKGYTLYLLPTQKYKNITISLKLQNKLSAETVSLRTLLSFMLTTGTQDLPSMQEFSQYLENMYGMKFGTSVVTKGKSHIINVNSVCINQEYLPYDEDLLASQIKLLSDVFHHPNIKGNQFDELMFKRKKKELKERLITNQDDKFYYSLEKMLEYMGKDQELGISAHGTIEALEKISNEDVYNYLQECLANDKKYVFVVGNIDESIVELFDKYLSFDDVNQDYETVYTYQSVRKDLLEIVEKQAITQAKLNMGYRIDVDYLSKHHHAFNLFNSLFGGMSQSKLFKVVREKNSLCYYISSSYDAFNGVMIVSAGIESRDYEKVKELVSKQLEAMKRGEFLDEDLEIAKKMLINSFIKTNDDPLSTIALTFNRAAAKYEEKVNYIQKIQSITREEIIAACQHVELDTIFLLKGREE